MRFLTPVLAFSMGLAVFAISLVTGCGGATTVSTSMAGGPPRYPFKRVSRSSVVNFSGVLQASESRELALKYSAYGTLLWIREEGAIVASGDVVARFDMSDLDDNFRSRKTAWRHANEQFATNQTADPFELGKLVVDLCSRDRDRDARREDFELLKAGKTQDVRWQADADYTRAILERDHARQILGFQREVNRRGFDTPFALRKLELETTSREVDADFARRGCDRLASGPTVEELARAEHQIEVASGEWYLAGRSLESASASRQISRKSIQFQIELNAARVQKANMALAQAETRAPCPGMIIYPLLWGQDKVVSGIDFWDGMAFMNLVSTGSFLMDTAVDETISAVLKPGMPALVRLDPWPAVSLKGKIASVGKVARRERGQNPSDFKLFPVIVAIDVATLPVRLGLKGAVSVIVASGTEVILPRDLVTGEGASATVRLEGFTGVSTCPVKVEPFDADFVRWIDPPSDSGILRY
ncbi:MAG: hypothetical protein HQM09_20565 [Candidatus Riflebacteria bacterium]|nr:hypothetical protein [Candidatus Riflebacteria bacterium]